jgi:two-component system chemotaxis response regulator CheB
MTARPQPVTAFPFPGAAFDVVGLAASAGGIQALGTILGGLPADFPAALVVVQHVSPKHKSRLAEVLGRRTRLPVKPAEDGDRLAPGRVYVAPPDRHVLINPDGTLSLTHTQRVRHVRPSADVLFPSLAASCGGRGVAVVLTGGDANGAAGVRVVKQAGGSVIAQDQATSLHFAMPRAAIETGCVDRVLPVGEIGPALDCLARADRGAGDGCGEPSGCRTTAGAPARVPPESRRGPERTGAGGRRPNPLRARRR